MEKKKHISALLVFIFVYFFCCNVFSQQGSSCSDPYFIYPAANCINTVVLSNGGTGYLGGKQCPRGHCGDFTMAGTTDIDGSCPGNDIAQTVAWLAVTATTDSFTINNNKTSSSGGATGNAIDYVIFSGTCGNLTEMGCYVINGEGGTQTITGLTVGQIYYVLVSRTGSSSSVNGNVCITSTVPYIPPGNECASAVSLNTDSTYTLNNAGASSTGPMCSGIVSTENVAWYQWCAPADWTTGQSAFINLNNQRCNGSSGLQLTVWNTGTTCPSANTDPTVICKNSDQNQQDYYFEWTALANTCYFISVDGYGGTACNYDITIGSIIIACDPVPTPTVLDQTICNGDSAVLTASGSTGNYKWYDAATGGNLLLTGDSLITPVLMTSNTYYILGFISNCESERVPVTVDVLELPAAEAGISDTILCSEPVLTLNGTGSSTGAGISYNWATSEGNILSGNNTLNPEINSTGTYVLSVANSKNGTSCISVDSVKIYSDTIKPIASIANPENLTCLVTEITLDATGTSSESPITHLWITTNGNIVSGSTTLFPVINMQGTYTITALNTVTGCSASESVTVISDSVIPSINIQTPDTLTCTTIEVTLSSTVTNGHSYLWTTTDGNITSGQNTQMPIINEAGIYSLSITNNITGCNSRDSVVVIQDLIAPVANIQSPEVITCMDSVLNLVAGSNSGATYNWMTIDGNIVSGSNTASPVIDAPGIYLLTVTGSNGCTDTASVEVFQNIVSPAVLLGNDTTLCIGQSFIPEVTVSGGSVYSWTPTVNVSDPNALNPVLNPQSSNTYTLHVINPDNGCKISDTINVNIIEVTAEISATATTGSAPLSIDLSGNSSGGTLYAWSLENESFATTLNTSYEFLTEGTYNIAFTASDINGCTTSDSITIEVEGTSFMNIPNVFTPNGDNKNDQFYIDSGNIVEFDIAIFNRWGEQLFAAPELSVSWDGRSISGKSVTEGTYFYAIKAKGSDNKTYNLNGSFSLLR